ncbi:MAG: DUF3572 domain-containing protein [Pseudomonadota bacterium]
MVKNVEIGRGDTRDAAETLALQALAWIAAHDDLMPVFLGSSGASEAQLRQGVADPELLAAVLDFLLMDDAWIMAFCDQADLPYARVMAARAALPGGGETHWT